MEKLEAGYIRGTFRDKEYEVHAPSPRPDSEPRAVPSERWA